ncbi:MAG: response regulator [Rhodocyclaceae bacterium]|nr:response regulator [Rhodocyclaceae bacterium]
MEEYGDGSSHSRQFCTTREAANRLGIALRTAQLWVDSGILEAWKTEGGHRRISLASVEKLANSKDAPAPRISDSPLLDEQNELRILVVEDDNILLKLYRMRIAAWNLPVRVTTASNGYDALILIGREQPDLMISDLRMPGMDGLQMVRTLTASSFREGMEIVIVSGMSPAEVADRGGLPQSVRLLPKPVPFNELKQIIESMLARRAELSLA